MSTRVIIDPAELRRELLAATVDDRTEIARQIVDDYRATAPVLTGAFRSDAEVVVDGTRVQVVDDNDDSQYIEYGTSDTPPHGTLTNAARKHGRYTGWKPR
jgi:hypothetical protein